MNRLPAYIYISVFALLTPLYAISAITNTYRTELEAVLAQTPIESLTACAHDHIDKYCLDILRVAATENVPLIRADATTFGELTSMISQCCAKHSMPVPRIFIALDRIGIDVKFCTYNQEGGILLHQKTFETYSTRVFRGYLEQVLLRMNKHFDHHATLVKQQQQKQHISACTVGLANSALFALSRAASEKPVVAAMANIVQLAAAAASTVWLYRLFTQKMSTYSFQRVSSFHNEEQAREDIFPGSTPEQSLEPVFNAPPTHMLEVIAQTQSFIRQRDAEFAELEQWQEEEALEQTRKAALEASQEVSLIDLTDDLPSQ